MRILSRQRVYGAKSGSPTVVVSVGVVEVLPQTPNFVICLLPLIAKPIPPRITATPCLQHAIGVVIVEGEGAGFEVVVVGEFVVGYRHIGVARCGVVTRFWGVGDGGVWFFNVGEGGADVAEVVGEFVLFLCLLILLKRWGRKWKWRDFFCRRGEMERAGCSG